MQRFTDEESGFECEPTLLTEVQAADKQEDSTFELLTRSRRGR
jgi:hypothetical protein